LDFHLNLISKKATLLKKLFDPNETVFAASQGNYEALPNGNILLGYGQCPIFKEFGPGGDVRLSTHWASPNSMSYRTFRFDWDARPAASPIVVANVGSAFMSWNGATDVKSWKIYEGVTATNLTFTKIVASAGFETKASISNSTRFVQVGAVQGNRLGSARKSNVVPVS